MLIKKTSKRRKVACFAFCAFYAHKKHLRGRKSLVLRFVLFMLFMHFMLFVLFMRFVHVKSSCKKKIIKSFKIALIPSSTTLLTCTPLNLPMKSYLYALIFFCDHLWGSFLFMRIFSVYENLSYPSVHTYSHLLLSFKIYSQ